MRRTAMVLAVLLFAVSCGGDGGPSLIGVWVGTEVSGGAEEWVFTFGTTDSSAAAAGTEIYEGTYVAYADEDPKRMDYTITESTFPQYVGERSNAIYRFDGDTLLFAANEPGVPDTPTDFVPGGGTRVWELTRQ